MREDLERSDCVVLEEPVFPYPHLKETTTPWESLLDMVGVSKDEVGEVRKITTSVVDARTKSARHSWCPRWRGYGGNHAVVFARTRSDNHAWCPQEEPRQQKGGRLRGDHGRYAYLVPAVMNM